MGMGDWPAELSKRDDSLIRGSPVKFHQFSTGIMGEMIAIDCVDACFLVTLVAPNPPCYIILFGVSMKSTVQKGVFKGYP